jgi:hypothetical protein
MSDLQRRQLELELKALISNERLSRLIRGEFHSPEELLDQWMRKREELGMWGPATSSRN